MSKTTKTIVGIIVVILVVWGIKALLKSTNDSETIKIGFIGALTGDAAEYGEPQRNALELAVADINDSGGISGRRLELIYEDGKCGGKDGANAAQKLVNVDKVKVILGGSCSSETLAALPIVDKGKVLIITGSATSPDLIGKSKFFARDYPNDLTQGKVLAEASNQRGWRTVAVIQEQTDYAMGIVKAFTRRFEELGGKVIAEGFSSETVDYRSIINKLKSSKPDALLISTQTTSSGERLLKQLQELKWRPALMINDVLGTGAEFLASNRIFLDGALTADFFLDPNNPKLKSLSDIYKQKYNKEIGFPNYTSAVYDSLYIVRDGILAAGYDGEKLAEWIRTIKDWQGASGLITIGADGERESGHVLKIIKNGKTEVLK